MLVTINVLLVALNIIFATPLEPFCGPIVVLLQNGLEHLYPTRSANNLIAILQAINYNYMMLFSLSSTQLVLL